MAEQQQQQQQTISAPFPTPPPFYKNFTKSNLAQLRQIRKEGAASQPTATTSNDTDASSGLDILALPSELRYLIPPPPPEDDKYRTFGTQINLHAPEQSLQEAGVEQLYPASTDDGEILNPQPHLLSLTRSLLSTFLTLLGLLSKDPTNEGVAKRIEDLQTIMFNVHDLINRYRPHQARESLLLLMEERVAKVRAEREGIERMKVRVREVMRELQEQGAAQGSVNSGGGRASEETAESAKQDDRSLRRQRAAWSALDSLNAADAED